MILLQAGKSVAGDFSFLSNFFAGAPFEWEGEDYRTAEHAFQAAKCARPCDRKLFSGCRTPGEAKRLGRRVQLRADWEETKLAVMESVLRAKFSLPSLRERLLLTGNCEIVHANTWHDQFWGDCVCPLHRAPGENHLGRLLMKLRTELQGGPTSDALGAS